MPFSKNVNTYSDVAAVLKAARDSGSTIAEYECDTPGIAVNFRARAYAYRKLLRDIARESVQRPGFHPTTEWDDMILTLDGRIVKIHFGRTTGVLRVRGQAVAIKPLERPPAEAEQIIELAKVEPAVEEEDELTAQARALVKNKGL